MSELVILVDYLIMVIFAELVKLVEEEKKNEIKLVINLTPEVLNSNSDADTFDSLPFLPEQVTVSNRSMRLLVRPCAYMNNLK